MSTTPTQVGIIGTGSMGLPMAMRLLQSGTALSFWSRRPRPELIAAGAHAADTPYELAQNCSVIVSMLPDLPELREVLEGETGLLAGDGELLLVVGSTSSAPAVRALAAEVAERTAGRVRLVDAPVSGGEDGAEAGTLSIMIGGSAEDAAVAAAALRPCGTPVHLGPLGAGEVAKACNQLVVAATILALGEATVLAERSGLDLDALWSLLSGGYAGSRLLDSRKDKLVSGDDSPSGVAQYMIKDLGFAFDIAESTGTAPALLPALRAAFDELVAAGLGDRDISVTRRFVAGRDTKHAA